MPLVPLLREFPRALIGMGLSNVGHARSLLLPREGKLDVDLPFEPCGGDEHDDDEEARPCDDQRHPIPSVAGLNITRKRLY